MLSHAEKVRPLMGQCPEVITAMPSRDETGQRLSGAQQERHKQMGREARRRAVDPTGEQATPSASGRDFRDLPPAPIGDPIAAIPWANDVLMVCMDRAMRDPETPLEWKLNYLKDAAAKLGMIRDKAAENKAIRDLLAERDRRRINAALEPGNPGPVPHIERPGP